METTILRSKRRTGFTLIELLIVIAIVAILAAILYPVFSRAREAGRKTSCMSNLKQIGHALAMYRNDNGETYLAVQLEAGTDRALWEVQVSPYIQPGVTAVEQMQIFLCPSFGGWKTACVTATTHGKVGAIRTTEITTLHRVFWAFWTPVWKTLRVR